MITRTLLIVLLVASSWAHPRGTKNVLVLFEQIEYSDTYTQYLKSLEEQGYNLEQKPATDKSLHLREWDDWKYDHLIIFASGIKAFGGALDVESILDFVDSGRSLILAVDSRVTDELRSLASDLGVDFEPRWSSVIDDHNYVTMSRGLDTTLVMSKQLLQEPVIFGDKPIQDPILYRGIGSTFSKDSEQVLQVLGGELTHYMANPEKGFTDEIQAVGRAISLVTLAQTRNDARVVISGSTDLFSDTFFQATDISTKQGQKYAKSGNKELVTQLTKWAFHERSVLLASNLTHHHSDTKETPSHYRITDDLDFSINILEYKDGSWGPFKASDVQLEFTMLDPHIRTFLKHDGQGKFFTSFKVPDVYGVFKFVIDYKRTGYTQLEIQEQVPVRHFKHNEFERFLVAAYPYYASAFSCMFAFFIFGFFFMYHKDR